MFIFNTFWIVNKRFKFYNDKKQKQPITKNHVAVVDLRKHPLLWSCENYAYFSVWTIHATQIGTSTPGQSGPGSNDNEEFLYTPQISRSNPHHHIQVSVTRGTSLSFRGGGGLTYLPGVIISIFEAPSLQGGKKLEGTMTRINGIVFAGSTIDPEIETFILFLIWKSVA